MANIEVRTQVELDAALLKATAIDQIVCCGDGYFELRDNAHAVLRDNAHAVLRDNAHAELRDNAHAELLGNAHAVLRDNAHAEASQASSLILRNRATAKCTDLVAVHIYGTNVRVVGGIQIKVPEITTAEQWCEWYGATVNDGIATLYKAVDDSYISSHGFAYTPGTTPKAPDWDGGKAECGAGLHFVAHPALGLRFKTDATKFIACPVRVVDIVVHRDASCPEKIKAPGVCAPVWECDRSGKPVLA